MPLKGRLASIRSPIKFAVHGGAHFLAIIIMIIIKLLK